MNDEVARHGPKESRPRATASVLPLFDGVDLAPATSALSNGRGLLASPLPGDSLIALDTPDGATRPKQKTQKDHVRGRRSEDLDRIEEALYGTICYRMGQALVAQGDSLELLGRVPDSSISLVVTDPPYHTTRKDNIYGDKSFREDQEYLEWISRYGQEWQRVLKPNGGLYIFCSTEMSGRLEVTLSEFLRPLNHITWTKPNDPGYDGWKGKMQKEALRRWYPHSERILFFEQAAPGHSRRSTLGQFLRDTRTRAGLSCHEVTEAIGEYGTINHGGAVSNWETGRNIPSRDQYGRLAVVLEATGRIEPMPPYEDVVRPFRATSDVEFTDVWTFPSVRPYSGKHPAEKPLDLLRHAIRASTYEGDIVLDCFAGSGATAVAAAKSGRGAVAFDIEQRWVQRIRHRLDSAESSMPHCRE